MDLNDGVVDIDQHPPAGPVAQDLGGQGGQEPRGDRVELADVTERERAQE